MDYYDSGTVDPITGMYVDKYGYPVVERGLPLSGIPANVNPTESERNIQTIHTDTLVPLNGSRISLPAVSTSAVTTSLVTGASPVVIRADGSSGAIILDNTSSGDAGVKVTPGDPNLIEAIRPGFATANLQLRTKGDSTLSFTDTDSNNQINITHDATSSVISSANSGAADSSIVIAPKRFGQLKAPDWGFQLYSLATQAISANTNTKVLFLSESFNSFPGGGAGMISYSGTNTYTNNSPQSVTLLVSASIRGTFNSTIGWPEMWITLNNALAPYYGKVLYPIGSATSFAIATTAILPVGPGDSFSVYVYVTEPATIGGSANHTMSLLNVRYLP